MKKIFSVVFLFLPVFYSPLPAQFTVTGRTESGVVGNITDEAGLTYNKTYDVAPGLYSGSRMSVVITYSSVTYSNVTFSTNAYSEGSGNIAITAHGLTTGVPVIARLTSGTICPPLTAETTYFAFPVSANIVSLSTTAAKAQASDPILFTSSKPAIGAQTYTLVIASPSISGSPIFTYRASNDNIGFFDLGISSTVNAYSAGGVSWGHDFGDFNYSILRLAITSPVAGGIQVKGVVRIKD